MSCNKKQSDHQLQCKFYNIDCQRFVVACVNIMHVHEITTIAISMWMSAKIALAMDYLDEDATLRSRC